jgi:glutathione S-transferase
MAPQLTLHVIPPSHPCLAAEKAIQVKGLDFEKVTLSPPHMEPMAEIYGAENTTVPGMLVDGEPVHGSTAIFERLEEIQPEPALYPNDAVREAERWGNDQLQDLGRRFTWGSMYFRPESMGTFAGGPPLDPPGTDFAMKFIRAT